MKTIFVPNISPKFLKMSDRECDEYIRAGLATPHEKLIHTSGNSVPENQKSLYKKIINWYNTKHLVLAEHPDGSLYVPSRIQK